MKRLAIPDDLFGIVRGAGGSCRIVVFFFQIRDWGEPISGEWISIGVGRDGRKGVCDGHRRGSFSGEGVLKRGRDRQI